MAHAALGTALRYACRFSEAVQFREQAIKLDPYPIALDYRNLALAYSKVGRYEDAIATCKKQGRNRTECKEQKLNRICPYDSRYPAHYRPSDGDYADNNNRGAYICSGYNLQCLCRYVYACSLRENAPDHPTGQE